MWLILPILSHCIESELCLPNPRREWRQATVAAISPLGIGSRARYMRRYRCHLVEGRKR